MSNTHGEFIQIGELRAFIDGVSDKCDHKTNLRGDTVYVTQSGKHVYWHTHREWASFTSSARDPLLYAHYDEIGDPIREGYGTCGKCGKVCYPDLFVE